MGVGGLFYWDGDFDEVFLNFVMVVVMFMFKYVFMVFLIDKINFYNLFV